MIRFFAGFFGAFFFDTAFLTAFTLRAAVFLDFFVFFADFLLVAMREV
jgi:hypothetical protein